MIASRPATNGLSRQLHLWPKGDKWARLLERNVTNGWQAKKQKRRSAKKQTKREGEEKKKDRNSSQLNVTPPKNRTVSCQTDRETERPKDRQTDRQHAEKAVKI